MMCSAIITADHQSWQENKKVATVKLIRTHFTMVVSVNTGHHLEISAVSGLPLCEALNNAVAP